MEKQGATDRESESAAHPTAEQRSRERWELRHRVSESVLRCPGGESSPRA
jgi:hypothetical protein